MPEEVVETPQAIGQRSIDWPRVILAAVFGFALLALLATVVYGGYWYGVQQAALTAPSPDEPRIVKSKKSPPDIPEELKCAEDNDCGINICDCKALNKNYIESEDKVCTRVCDKTPTCYQNRCIFKGEENKYKIERALDQILSTFKFLFNR